MIAAALTSSLAGCASTGKKGETRYVARDVDTLYNGAKDRLDRRQYKVAAALFDEVERQHPYSLWARRAQLMSAFSYYLARDYTESISSAQRFLSIRQQGCALCALPGRGGLLRADPGRHPRSEDHAAGA
jgi:outer membrane protein assembly factor BamD